MVDQNDFMKAEKYDQCKGVNAAVNYYRVLLL